jgi:transcriptional repressor NF-X1
MIEVTCSCGHLTQQARCGSSDSKPEGNIGRQVKCTDACAVAKRNAQLAEALGVEKKEPKIREVEYDQTTLSFYAANLAWCKGIEEHLM